MPDSLEIDLGVGNLQQAVTGFRDLSRVLDGMKILEGFGITNAIEGATVLSVIALAATALRGFVGAIHAAAEALSEFGHARERLGGTTGETALLKALGGVAGVSDIAGAGRRLHESTLSGMGTAAAAQLGLPIRPLEIGSATDEAQLLIKALEGLSRVYKSDPAAARALIRNLHMEEWIDVIRLWDEVGERMKRNAEATAGAFSETNTDNATRFKAAMNEVGLAWQNLTTMLSAYFIPKITEMMHILSLIIQHPFAFAATSAAFGPLAAIHMLEAKELAERSAKAQHENIRALNQNTETVRDLANGLFGGGRRARTAIPGGFGPGAGAYLSEVLHSHAVRLGAYSVSL
jgi:hypothetical protein